MKKITFYFFIISLIYLNAISQVLDVQKQQRDYWGNNHIHLTNEAMKLIFHSTGASWDELIINLDLIRQGNLEEDEIDLVYHLGGLFGFGVTTSHFWNADLGDNQRNNFGAGYNNIENAFMKVNHYIHGDYLLYITDDQQISHHFYYPDHNNVFGLINYLNTGYVNCEIHGWETHSPVVRTSVTYQLLGHMCHLLQDMSVPIHTHVHIHETDEYEEHVGQNGLPGYLDVGTFRFNNFYYGNDLIRGLFYTSNQIANFFPGQGWGLESYNILGNGVFQGEGLWMLTQTFSEIFPAYHYQIYDYAQQGFHTGKHAINATAGLLAWFASTANLTITYPPVITNITSNMIGSPQYGYTLFKGQTGSLYSTVQGSPVNYDWNYKICSNGNWWSWPLNNSGLITTSLKSNPHFVVKNNDFAGQTCPYVESEPSSLYLTVNLRAYNNLTEDWWWPPLKINPSINISGGGCPYIFVLGNDSTGGKYFTENNILHHSEFTENLNQSITDVYKLKTVPKIDSNKITIQIMETENDVNYFDQIKLFAVDHPVGSKIGITESNDIVMYYPEDVSSTDFATQNFSSNNIAPYIQYGQPLPKITGLNNDFLNSHYDSTSQNLKLKSYINRLKAKGFKNFSDSLALIGEIGSDALVQPIIAKDWAGSISVYTNSDTYIRPFSKRVNVSDVIIPFSQTGDIVDHVDINFNSDYALSYFSIVPVSYEGFTKTELSLLSAVHAVNGNVLSSLSNIDNDFAVMDTTAIIDLKFGNINPPDPSMVRDYVFVVNGKYTSENRLLKGKLLQKPSNNNLKPDNVTYEYKLNANYPNPFNPTTKISYSLAKSGNTKLVVYDILGRLMNVIVNEYKSAGEYMVDFNGSHLSSGVYIYRLESNGFVDNKRMVLLK